MAARCYALTLDQFAELVESFPFKRHIEAVHLHHLRRPSHADFLGQASLESLQEFYVRKGLCDLPQHVTIDPAGTIWTGRHWDLPPASVSGHNGNLAAGPFVIQLVGDFGHGIGSDSFEGVQRQTALAAIARLQARFQLPVESLKFHSHLASVKCPGESLDYPALLDELRQQHEAQREADEAAKRRGRRRPLSDKASEIRLRVEEVLQAMRNDTTTWDQRHDAEPAEDSLPEVERELLAGPRTTAMPAARGGSDGELRPQDLDRLRPHVVLLDEGQFAEDGRFDEQDVRAIFDEHLERALAEAKARQQKLRLMFYAHGGLTPESAGLAMAAGLVSWWKSNGIYPIYFIWKTGFMETLRNMLPGWLGGGRALARDLADFTTDPLIEAAARRLGGVTIWSGMKRAAELSSAADGGARFVAQRLAEFCRDRADDIELYAVGHSAGSIFHAHFIPAARSLGAPPFQAAYFLAPAIRVDEFHRRLAPLVRDKSIGRLDLFTMTKFHELADNCEQVYRKSLLYLIYYGLEPQRKTPILGLDESLRADRALRELFGLNGRTASTGEVVWSPSAAATGRSASRSLTHGGFDNDRATMESVARRIVNRDDIEPFPEAMIGRVLARAAEAELPVAMGPPAATPTGFAASPVATAPTPVSDFRGAVSAGRRRALCVGIDDYPTSRLQGCVRDARTWSQTLQQLGFEAQLLLDGQASREAMLQALTELVATSRAGDVVAFQFAGHGTTLPDLNGDETGGDTPGQDEAFVPHDYQRGAFLIDDDVAGVFRRIPAGVNVTCFIDCCHSGTITRLLVGVRPPPLGPDERPRFMAADAAMMESHRQFRAAEAGRAARAVVPPRDPEAMSEVLFSACRSDEVALESNGQGEFTVRATRLLQRGLGGMTNADFQQQVVAAFGSAPRQHPQLDCAAGARRRALLLPLAGAGRDPLVPAAGEGPPAGAGLAGGDLGAIANGLRAFADLLQPRA